MSDTESRIEQFRQMTVADPNNELGHFSLGRAYLDAGRPADAIVSLEHALKLNPNLGRAYHLLGEAQIRSGAKTDAIDTLTRGVKVAASRGEALAKKEMAKLLQDLGAPLPAEATSEKAAVAGEGQVVCCRCGQAGPRLPKAPFRNAQGQLIYEKVCANCWKEWIGMGTKVINELHLSMNDPEAQRVFDRHMYEFLNLPQ
jgi:Fe-S cluster biosynthesis and repair protein YggX